MRKRPTSSLPNCLIVALFCLSFSSLNGQNEFYISASDRIYCGEPTYFNIIYNLYNPGELIQTEWEIISINGSFGGHHIYGMDDYFLEVVFFSASGYWVIANSITSDSLFLSDTIYIEVEGFFSEIEVLSCYEVNPVTECYQVCSTSPTIIQLYQGMEFEIWGAVDYKFINPETIEVIWSDAGGSMMIYGQCQFSICFEVFPVSTADFKTQPLSINDTLTVCMNEEIFFENISSSGIEYVWSFGDGSQSVSYDAYHRYKAEGFYTVTLQAENICECDSEKQLVVKVLPATVPVLDCINSVCPGTRQIYTAASDGCTLFNWSVSPNGTIVNGGGPDDDYIEVIWHEGPDGIIDLEVSGCLSEYCSSSSSFRVPIITTDGPIEGDTKVCTGEIVVYSAPYFPGTQYQWKIGPEGDIISEETTNTISVRWNDVNIVTTSFVAVQYDNCFLECAGRDTLSVAITPEISLSGENQVCQNTVATIDAAAGFTFPIPVNVQWHIEDEKGVVIYSSGGLSASFSHTFNVEPGEYYWVATNSSDNYCNETIRQKITVTARPEKPLGITGEEIICPGQTYSFSIVPAGNFSTLWNITDGASVFNYKGGTCQHIFGSNPPYIVQATHSDIQYQACVSDPVSIELKTNSDLIIKGPDEACFNTISGFSTTYISGTEYAWEIIPPDHGEIKRTDLNQVEIFWTKEGSATIRLLTCNTILEKQVLISGLPPFDLTGPLSVCVNELASIATNTPLLSHTWVDENNTIIGVGNMVNLSEGVYAVSVEDPKGCVSEKPFTINSYPLPSIHLTTASPTIFCNTIPPGVEVVANSDGLGYIFEWFKDDISMGLGGPVFTVNEFGTYHAAVINEYGCKALSGKITFEDCCLPADCIGTLPGCEDGCTYLPQDFNINKGGSECQSRQYVPLWPDIIPDQTRWAISSTSTGTIAIIDEDILTFNYLLPGYYNIIMVALVNGFPYTPGLCGHLQEFNDTIRAVADFKYSGICKSDPIQFKDLTTFLPDETITNWSWDFGDPASGIDNSSSLQNPVHQFSDAGDFIVKLTVSMMSGCITSKTIQVTITEGPDLMPVYDNIYCQNEALTFHLPGDVFDIQWEFGDPVSGIQNNAFRDSVLHTYSVPGFYTASVSASDIANCRSQQNVIIEIRSNNLTGNITIDPSYPICFGDTVLLTSPPGGISWLWNTGEITEQISVTESNQFNLLLTDQYNCTYAPPAESVTVLSIPEIIVKARQVLGPDLYGPWQDSLQLCYGSEFEIQVFSPGVNNYNWLHGVNGDILFFSGEGGNLPDPGHYQYTVVAEDVITYCLSNAYSISIEIFDRVDKPVISLSNGSGCGNDENTLQVVNPVAGTIYSWSDGQFGIDITTTHSGTYTVIATDHNGCTSQSDPIVIKPSAHVDQIPSGCYLKCDPLSVCLPPLNDVSAYSIFQNGILIESGTSWPNEFLITADGSYVIEVTSPNGCVATSDPLNISLYIGLGSITVLTYLDADGDGAITGSDILLSGIPVRIISEDSLIAGMTVTDAPGQFVFEDYPASSYTAIFDRTLLSSEWKIVIDSVKAQITTCGDSVIVSLLLKENCLVQGADQFYELCPGDMLTIGDSTLTDTGVYEMHMSSLSGCDSLFYVYIARPDSLEIEAVVWVDVDKNGIVSSADTVIQGIPVMIDRMINQAPYILITDPNGRINGWFESGLYAISVDSTSLPPGLTLLSGISFNADTACGPFLFNFLLSPSCVDGFIIRHEELCAGDSVSIEGNWIDEEGVYSFVINQPGSGCDTVMDVYVNTYPQTSIASVIDWDCIDLGTIILTPEGAGPFAFEWNNQIQGDSILKNLSPSNYIVTVTDINGCQSIDSIIIPEQEELVFHVQEHYEIFAGDTIHIQIEGDISQPGLIYNWSPSTGLDCNTCSSTIAYPLQNSIISIHITDDNGCEYSLLTEVVVLYPDTNVNDAIYIPNVFTPDGNGINDRFMIYSQHPDAYLVSLSIFDRWGTLLFNTNEILVDAFTGWDGTYRRKPMNPGVYTFKANYRLADGTEKLIYGDVTLVR